MQNHISVSFSFILCFTVISYMLHLLPSLICRCWLGDRKDTSAMKPLGMAVNVSVRVKPKLTCEYEEFWFVL